MGNGFSKVFNRFFGTKDMRLLMLGLDAAGKTTILHHLKHPNDPITTIPTVGFNVESVTFRNVKFNVWDVGGQEKIRPLWRHYYSGTQGLIFVVDSSDEARIDEAAKELAHIIQDRELANCRLLIFANKQDLSGAMDAGEVAKRLKLSELNVLYNVIPSIATQNVGLEEGLTWLHKNINPTSPTAAATPQ